jgi:hypothetical protein
MKNKIILTTVVRFYKLKKRLRKLISLSKIVKFFQEKLKGLEKIKFRINL